MLFPLIVVLKVSDIWLPQRGWKSWTGGIIGSQDLGWQEEESFSESQQMGEQKERERINVNIDPDSNKLTSLSWLSDKLLASSSQYVQVWAEMCLDSGVRYSSRHSYVPLSYRVISISKNRSIVWFLCSPLHIIHLLPWTMAQRNPEQRAASR